MSVLPAAVPRTTVSYGSFVFNEAAGCRITTEYTAFDQPEDGSVYFEFDLRLLNPTGVVATDDAAFGVLRADAERLLRIARQRLLIQTGGVTVKDLNFSSTVTALEITPELTLMHENCRDYHYSFRARCGYPGNVPGNLFRRTSITKIESSIQANRTCALQAVWTASSGITAYQQFLNNGAAFYTAYLPAVLVDAQGISGQWHNTHDDPHYNDENSVIAVTRTYIEIFNGRRDSVTTRTSTIGDRRTLEIPSEWTSSPDGHTALQNYTDNGGAFFTAKLPAVPAGGAWVLVHEQFGYNDQNGQLHAMRVYHETANGLRDYRVSVTTDAAQLRTLTVSGVYYNDGVDARQNYNTDITSLIAAVIAKENGQRALPITHYESVSIPTIEHYDTTYKRYYFERTIRELAYQQGPGGVTFDDANVTMETLDLQVEKPYGAFSKVPSQTLTRLNTVTARFVATIDLTSAGGTDPVTLWGVGGLRAFVSNACITKLGAAVSSVEVVGEQVGVGLHANQLVGTLVFVVKGGSLLWCEITQTLAQIPGRDFAPRADGTAFSLYPYRAPPEKILHRECWLEYVVGYGPPAIFNNGADDTVSGFGLISTGATAQASIDAQNAAGTLALGAGWFIDRRAGVPYSVTSKPTTRGDLGGYRTVLVHQVETWRYVDAVDPGSVIP